MVRISFIIPVPYLADVVFKTFDEHTRQHAPSSGDGIAYSLSVFVAPTIDEVTASAVDAEIVIARGVLAYRLAKKYPQLAVVPVQISGAEIIAAIAKAVDKVGKLPVAVIGAFNMLYSAKGLDSLLGMDIQGYLQETNNHEDLRAVIDSVRADGRRIVVCGPNTAKFADREPDLCCTVVDMSRESIWQALNEAKHLSAIRRKELEKAAQFQAILDSAIEGIMVIDDFGRVIVLNQVGERLLGINAAECLGKSASELFPRSRFSSIIRSGAEYNQEIVTYGESTLALNKVGLTIRGDSIGNVVTFQEVASIQREEIKIRNKMYLRGHVANYRFEDIAGESEPLRETISQAKNYASVSSNILIIGETGTGKEMFAQSIHNASDRKNGPFVAINCAALSTSLLESELFGYAEGAFTGASKGGKPGVFELAHTGTIFLDEISEIPLNMQGRLLRVIQERQIMRVGDDRVIPVDVRIISASNKPLLTLVRRHEFRSDLYYRLNVLTLRIPPLRARGADALILADAFLEEYCRKFKKANISLTQAARAVMTSHSWDGNIRELRNICECLAVGNDTGAITEADLAKLFDYEPAEMPTDEMPDAARGHEILAIEKNYLIKTLKSCGYDKHEAARKLGISGTTLWRRLKKYGIAMPKTPG